MKKLGPALLDMLHNTLRLPHSNYYILGWEYQSDKNYATSEKMFIYNKYN